MLVIKAIQFAATKHIGQIRRGSGLPYVTHTIIVMELIQKYKGCSTHIGELKCAALLHDTLEDTDCNYKELEREFGPMVASIVLELTSDEEMIKKIGKNEYLKKKMVEMSRYAFILKLLDRYSNCMDNPTTKYRLATIELMAYLLKNRKDITERQINIIKEIKNVCLEEIEPEEEEGPLLENATLVVEGESQLVDNKVTLIGAPEAKEAK